MKWLIPKEFIKSSEYSILGEIDAHELEPGFLGNCNLIPTLSCLATKPEIVKQIFVSQGLNACGYILLFRTLFNKAVRSRSP